MTTYVENQCAVCGLSWECLEVVAGFVCDDCETPAPEIEHPRTSDYFDEEHRHAR